MRWLVAGGLFEAAVLSLPLSRNASPGPTYERSAAEGVLTWLQQRADVDFATPLEEDEAREKRLLTEAGEPTRILAILRYRIQRKHLWAKATEILRAHISAHR